MYEVSATKTSSSILATPGRCPGSPEVCETRLESRWQLTDAYRARAYRAGILPSEFVAGIGGALDLVERRAGNRTPGDDSHTAASLTDSCVTHQSLNRDLSCPIDTRKDSTP